MESDYEEASGELEKWPHWDLRREITKTLEMFFSVAHQHDLA